ncbi:MAG: hypothetical protein KDA63_11870 [Planctomycetales bacterium]|nr:hypothetical protein [Planctomycetales bacterium]
MRLTLKDLLGIVAFCAVVAWCGSWAGADNVTFWVAVVGSAFVSGVFVTVARDENLHRWSPFVPLPLLLCCLMPFVSLSLLVNGVLLFGVGVFCACRRPLGVRTIVMLTIICACVSLVVGVYPGIAESRRLLALRDEFPIQPLDTRLGYERNRPMEGDAPAVLNANVSTELNDWENEISSSWLDYRALQFLRIHDHQYELFVRASGFGVTRMMRPWLEELRRPPLRDIDFDETRVANAETAWNGWRAIDQLGTSQQPEHLHRASRTDFFDPDGFGAMVAPHQAVGFVEHGFHYSPLDAMTNRESWTIARLELVGLLKFDEPRVYVLDHLPRMDQISNDDVPTRALDSFETAALAQLWTDEDIVVARDGRQLRMLGSLRAATACLDCHDARRGDLLGAFSYELQMAPAHQPDQLGAE